MHTHHHRHHSRIVAETTRLESVGAVLIETMISGYGLSVDEVAAGVGVSTLAVERFRRRQSGTASQRSGSDPYPEAA